MKLSLKDSAKVAFATGLGLAAGLGLATVLALAAGCGPKAPAGPMRYQITVGADGYAPDHVKARAGQEVVLVFTRTTDRTCATEVVIPSEHRTVALPLNQPVEVKLVPKEKGEISFTCGMQMFQGTVEVD
jgi:plastocyanin domain-containing protein